MLISNIKKQLANESVINALMVTGATIISGFFSYLLQIHLGRQLSVADYGTFNSLLALFNISTFFNVAITISTIKLISELFGKGKNGVISQLYWKLATFFTFAGLLLILFLVVIKKPLADFLNIDNPDYFVLFGIYVLSIYLTVTPISYLQGMLKFKKFSAYILLSGIFRSTITGALAFLGYKVGVLYLGMSFANFIMFTYAFFVLKPSFAKKKPVELAQYYKKIFSFSIPVLLIYFSMLFFYNFDILMVKRWFDAESTGIYVGASTMGKMILFGTGAVTAVMFPQISALKAKGKDYSSKLKTFASLQIALVLIAFGSFSLFPGFITQTLFGARFVGAIPLLPMYALFISIYVLINFLVQFFMAIEKTKVVYFLMLLVVGQIAALNLFHSSIEQIIQVNIILMGTLLISFLAYGRPYFKKN